MASVVNLKIDQGATWSADVTLVDETDTVLNLTGFSVRGQFRKHYGSSTGTSFTAVLVSPNTNGQITISLTGTQTNTIVPGRYVYDVEIENNSTITRVMEGQLTVSPGATRESGVVTKDIYGVSITPA